MINKVETDLQVYFDMPYDIAFSDDPFDNLTSRVISTWGDDATLGMVLEECQELQHPKLTMIRKSTPSAKIKKWRSQLRGASITAVNGKRVTTIKDVRDLVAEHRKSSLETDIEVQFATINKQAMQPQMGIPQVYQDQMNVIGKHLWEIHNDPDWAEQINNAMPALKAINRSDTVFTKNDKAQMHHAGMHIKTAKVTGNHAF